MAGLHVSGRYPYYAMFHGTDERIPLSALEASVRIMDRFLEAALCPGSRGCGRPIQKFLSFLAECLPSSEPMCRVWRGEREGAGSHLVACLGHGCICLVVGRR
jgi:hypothetical protein